MDGLTLVKDTAAANLIATSLSLTLFGFYTCLFMRTLQVLKQKRYSMFSFTSICLISCYLFNFVITITSLIFAYKGFIAFPQGPSPPISHLCRSRHWITA
ncbi:hypothetical protein FRB94_011874 [Tulasnella sp. JGI-2019a]|nr:hypothetical protein FRB94_011874 [Tulasnella sp. JGI-2019a]